jgi:hypothetical protein
VLVGGISSLVSAAVITGETDRLRELTPQVLDLVRRLIG